MAFMKKQWHSQVAWDTKKIISEYNITFIKHLVSLMQYCGGPAKTMSYLDVKDATCVSLE